MCDYICKCIKGEYKGLEFGFKANELHKNSSTDIFVLFFKDIRQASDFIIKFFLNAYENKQIELSIDNNVVHIRSKSVTIEKAVI